MAKFTLGSFEIAEKLGLKYLGEKELIDDEPFYTYEYSINGQEFYVAYGWGDDDALSEEEAHEEAGKRVMAALGKLIVV